MAYAALTSLRQTTEKITLNQDLYSVFHDKQQIRSMNEDVIFLQESAKEFQEEANNLEGRAMDVAIEAQYVIQHLISERSSSRFQLNQFLVKCACGKGETKYKRQLEKIREKIDSIAGDVMEMNKKKKKKKKNHTTIEVKDEKISVSDAAAVGLEDDLIAIKSRLCGGSPRLQVIPIVGMGGIGKTTLSRNVYDDPLVVQYFDIRAWATVSQDHCLERMFSSLMDSINVLNVVGSRSGQSDELTLYKSLKGRRYLIVMDDIWSTQVWDEVRDLFPDDNNGSRIMITSRLSDVAAYYDSRSPLHEMRLMGLDISWDLLRQRVFGDEGVSLELERERIGKWIAESCRGLPLAIVVIAGILSTVGKDLNTWREIARNVSSIVAAKDGQFEEILSLSYTHLPHHLRPFLLYMGGFPEDHEIRISKLVRLCVAEGFTRGTQGSSKSLEDEAEDCVEDLVNRNLVLVTKRKSNGKIKSCSLHDMMRDLCIRIAQDSNFFVNLIDRYIEKGRFIERVKDQNRLIVYSSKLTYLSCIPRSKIHTILCFQPNGMSCCGTRYSVELDFLKSVRMLRVLDAENADIKLLPDQLFGLFHLRYLAIRSMSGFMIPAAISKLQNLQTLIIKASNAWDLIGRPNVECLPHGIWMMLQLRHLVCYGSLPYPRQTTSALKNLHTLSLVLHDTCVGGILEKIPNIKKLGIDCSYYDYGTHLNNLENLHQLESLKLQGGDWRKDSIRFPLMLRKLTLCNMSLPWSEMSIVGSLPNLEVLKLKDFACIGTTWETSEGEFPQLQYLLIQTSKLQFWITEQHHFPRLKVLLLHDCWYLNEIPEGMGEIATLELIDVRGDTHLLPKSLVESLERIREEQQSFGNDALQLLMKMRPIK